MSAQSPAILLHPDDNVLVCRSPIAAGQQFMLGGELVKSIDAIEIGHKIARRALKAGDKIVKYGAPIGSAVTDIDVGQHVHLHNLKSDYIASHTRELD
jgi:(2R)-sulfolactate sulfo-lyase subunit alpha